MIPTRVPRTDVLDPLAPAQARYAAGTREILENYFTGTPVRDEYLIVAGGALAGTGARSYTATT